MSFIERVGQRRVGFYCWKLFVINYFRGYEVSIESKCEYPIEKIVVFYK